MKDYSETGYNGWKNRQTWNVALWINNDESYYRWAVHYMKTHEAAKNPYIGFITLSRMTNGKTPDGIKWSGTRLDYPALNEMMRDLIR